MIHAQGGTCTILPTDLSRIDDVTTLIQSIIKKSETVDAIVNIAGIWHSENEVFAGKDFQNFDQQVIVDTYTVGFTAPSLLIHGLLPKMPDGASIVNLSGTFENGGAGWLPYYASKRALEDFTIGLAQELVSREIQVNAVSPSDTATEQYARFFPEYMPDAIEPAEIAQKIVELCAPENILTGQVVVMKKGIEPFNGFHS